MLNHGFGGCTAEELLYYYPRAVKAFAPKGLIICVYWNDRTFGYTNEEIMERIAKVFELARKDFPGIKLALCDARPLYSGKDRDEGYYKCVSGFNALCREYCETHPDCKLIEHKKAEFIFEKGYAGDYGMPCKETFIEDKVHFSPEGYLKYAEFFKTELQNYF